MKPISILLRNVIFILSTCILIHNSAFAMDTRGTKRSFEEASQPPNDAVSQEQEHPALDNLMERIKAKSSTGRGFNKMCGNAILWIIQNFDGAQNEMIHNGMSKEALENLTLPDMKKYSEANDHSLKTYLTNFLHKAEDAEVLILKCGTPINGRQNGPIYEVQKGHNWNDWFETKEPSQKKLKIAEQNEGMAFEEDEGQETEVEEYNQGETTDYYIHEAHASQGFPEEPSSEFSIEAQFEDYSSREEIDLNAPSKTMPVETISNSEAAESPLSSEANMGEIRTIYDFFCQHKISSADLYKKYPKRFESLIANGYIKEENGYYTILLDFETAMKVFALDK